MCFFVISFCFCIPVFERVLLLYKPNLGNWVVTSVLISLEVEPERFFWFCKTLGSLCQPAALSCIVSETPRLVPCATSCWFCFTFPIPKASAVGLSPPAHASHVYLFQGWCWTLGRKLCFPELARLQGKHLTPSWHFLEMDTKRKDELLVSQTHSSHCLLGARLYAFIGVGIYWGKWAKLHPELQGKSRRQRFPVTSVNAVVGRCNKHWNQVVQGHVSAEKRVQSIQCPLNRPCHRALVAVDNKPAVIVVWSGKGAGQGSTH